MGTENIQSTYGYSLAIHNEVTLSRLSIYTLAVTNYIASYVAIYGIMVNYIAMHVITLN